MDRGGNREINSGKREMTILVHTAISACQYQVSGCGEMGVYNMLQTLAAECKTRKNTIVCIYSYEKESIVSKV